MNKMSFMRMVSAKTGFTLANCTKAYDAIVECFIEVVKNNDSIILENLGKLYGVVIPEHEKNWLGGTIIVEPKTKARFEFSQKFKAYLAARKNLEEIRQINEKRK